MGHHRRDDDLHAAGPVADDSFALRKAPCMSVIAVRHLCKRFGGIAAIDDLSFSVERGAIYAIIGPNGAGKTTLINLLSGIYVPDDGTISILGKDSHNEQPEHLAARD